MRRRNASWTQIVCTPGWGNGRAARVAARIAGRLERRGRAGRIECFRSAPDLLAWSATCAGGFSELVCVGGDATVSAAAPAAMRLGVPLLPVPMGFGNLFADSFRLPAESRGALSVLGAGAVRDVDAGIVGGEVFLCHASYGLLADIEKAMERGRARPRERWKRHLGYYAIARDMLAAAPLPSIQVEVDGRLLIRDAVIATVANVQTYRGFLNLTPEASATDGWFDVAVMERGSRLQVWGRLLRMLLGGSPERAGIQRCRGRRVRVLMEGQAPLLARMLPAALPLIVPPAVAAAIPASPTAAALRLSATRRDAPLRWTPVPAGSTRAAALDAAG
jgi:diacylglycerol kinase family enzyme